MDFCTTNDFPRKKFTLSIGFCYELVDPPLPHHKTYRMIRSNSIRLASTLAVKAIARNPSHVAISRQLSRACLTKVLPLKNAITVKSYSVLTTPPAAKNYDYESIKKIASNPKAYPNTLVVDVREPVEYEEGHIPSAVNIPFKSSPGALGLSDDEFEAQFGFKKPDKDKELIFYCLAGVRSSAAEDLANTFGYKNRGNYVGSYEDWLTHQNESTK